MRPEHQPWRQSAGSSLDTAKPKQRTSLQTVFFDLTKTVDNTLPALETVRDSVYQQAFTVGSIVREISDYEEECMRKRIGILILASFGLTACPPPPTPPAPAQVRFVHAVPDIGAARIIEDGVAITSSSTEPSYTNTFPVTPPYRDIAIAAGQSQATKEYSFCSSSAGDCSATLKPTALSFESGKKYTVIFIGTNAAGDDAGADGRPVQVVRLEDNQGSPSGSNRVRLRFVHTVPDPTRKQVNVYLTDPGADLSLTSPIAANLGYGTATPITPPIERIGDLTYQLRVTPTTSTTPLLDAGTATYNAGKSYTLLILQAGGSFAGGVIRLPDN